MTLTLALTLTLTLPRSTRTPSPWVVTLDNFLTDEEVAAFNAYAGDVPDLVEGPTLARVRVRVRVS